MENIREYIRDLYKHETGEGLYIEENYDNFTDIFTHEYVYWLEKRLSSFVDIHRSGSHIKYDSLSDSFKNIIDKIKDI